MRSREPSRDGIEVPPSWLKSGGCSQDGKRKKGKRKLRQDPYARYTLYSKGLQLKTER
jgi:hypothetical protein